MEVLAALAVAGILASLGVSVYSGQTERSRVAEAIAEISQIELAIALQATRPGNAEGGPPRDLAELGLDASVLTDPWGRPYRYARGDGAPDTEVRRDRNDRRLNRDYDLFSLGRDGVSASSLADARAADDIVRGANGGFVGAAADYGVIGGAATGGLSAGAAAGRAGGPSAAGGLDPRR